MANAKEHSDIGIVTGAVTGAIVLRDQPWLLWLLGIVTNALTGKVGAALPDKFEPASRGPNHRRFWHSRFILLITLGVAVALLVGAFLIFKKVYSKRCHKKHVLPNQRVLELSQKSFRIANFFAPGLFAGYASHLVRDSVTPKGLPLL